MRRLIKCLIRECILFPLCSNIALAVFLKVRHVLDASGMSPDPDFWVSLKLQRQLFSLVRLRVKCDGSQDVGSRKARDLPSSPQSALGSDC